MDSLAQQITPGKSQPNWARTFRIRTGLDTQSRRITPCPGRGDWILSLDADEILTPPLVAEIEMVLSGPDSDVYNGFRLPRILFIGERAVKHGGFYPDAQLRLIRRGTGSFKDRAVHEAISVDGKVKCLQNHMLHYSYKNLEQFEAAMEKYARLSAVEHKNQGKKGFKASTVNEMLHPLWTFFWRYFVRLGFLDGDIGWKTTLIYSDYVRKKIRYLRESLQSASE